MITAIANNELEIGNLAFSTLADRDRQCRHGRHPGDHRRFPGRQCRLLQQRIRGARRRSDQEDRGPQGQGGRDQRRRQRRRRRHARHAAQARARSQPRLHDHRGAVPRHARDAGGKEGRSDSGGAAVLARSRTEKDRHEHCSTCGTPSACRRFVMWSARKPFIDAHRAALVDFLEDSLRIVHWYLDPKNHDAAPKSLRSSPNNRPSTSAGSSPRTITTAIPI